MTENSIPSPDEASRYLALKVMMMPRDTNPYGTIFGGVLLSYIDQAGAIGARHELARLKYPKRDLVTVALDKVEFHEPVFVGDAVSLFTRQARIGRSSITMHVQVEAERDGVVRSVTKADVTFVAITSEGGQRRPVPLGDPSES